MKKAFGRYLAKLRTSKGMTLRDVEAKSGNKVSNAYLSQLEHGKVKNPSVAILHSLSSVYEVSCESLIKETLESSSEKGQEWLNAIQTYAISGLSKNEEKEMLEYLAIIRSKKSKGRC